MIERFYNKIFRSELPNSVRNIFKKVFMLYGLWSLDKHQTTLFQGIFLYFIPIVNIARPIYLGFTLFGDCLLLSLASSFSFVAHVIP